MSDRLEELRAIQGIDECLQLVQKFEKTDPEAAKKLADDALGGHHLNHGPLISFFVSLARGAYGTFMGAAEVDVIAQPAAIGKRIPEVSAALEDHQTAAERATTEAVTEGVAAATALQALHALNDEATTASQVVADLATRRPRASLSLLGPVALTLADELQSYQAAKPASEETQEEAKKGLEAKAVIEGRDEAQETATEPAKAEAFAYAETKKEEAAKEQAMKVAHEAAEILAEKKAPWQVHVCEQFEEPFSQLQDLENRADGLCKEESDGEVREKRHDFSKEWKSLSQANKWDLEELDSKPKHVGQRFGGSFDAPSASSPLDEGWQMAVEAFKASSNEQLPLPVVVDAPHLIAHTVACLVGIIDIDEVSVEDNAVLAEFIFNELKKPSVILLATQPALAARADEVAEVIKSRIKGLHQITELETESCHVMITLKKEADTPPPSVHPVDASSSDMRSSLLTSSGMVQSPSEMPVPTYVPSPTSPREDLDVTAVATQLAPMASDPMMEYAQEAQSAPSPSSPQEDSDKGYQPPLESLVKEFDHKEDDASDTTAATGHDEGSKGRGRGASKGKGRGEGKGKSAATSKGKDSGKGKGKSGKGKNSKGKYEDDYPAKGKGKAGKGKKGRSKSKSKYDDYDEPKGKGKSRKGKGKSKSKSYDYEDRSYGKSKGKGKGKSSSCDAHGKGKSSGKGSKGKGKSSKGGNSYGHW